MQTDNASTFQPAEYGVASNKWYNAGECMTSISQHATGCWAAHLERAALALELAGIQGISHCLLGVTTLHRLSNISYGLQDLGNIQLQK